MSTGRQFNGKRDSLTDSWSTNLEAGQDNGMKKVPDGSHSVKSEASWCMSH